MFVYVFLATLTVADSRNLWLLLLRFYSSQESSVYAKITVLIPGCNPNNWRGDRVDLTRVTSNEVPVYISIHILAGSGRYSRICPPT